MDTIWLYSKTEVPAITKTALERERLLQLLQNGKSAKLTVVQAPGGYGKTTILSQWISKISEPTSWFSIDSLDNDPVRFWKYVIQSVSNSLNNDLDKRLLPLFSSNLHPPSELIIDSFLNEISSLKENLHIVLDDYHVIEHPVINDMMIRFIDYLPNNTRIYILSRTRPPLPLARWRMDSTLTEIGLLQLCFTYEEVKKLYEEKNLKINEENVFQNVLDITEGWAAGIQLASLSIMNNGINEGRFDGSHPFVADFLIDEIFETLPPDTQHFLLQTSILNMLEPQICDLLTNRSDSCDILVELEEKGVFTVRMSSIPPVFRYHHLFADVLQTKMRNFYSEEQVRAVCQKAGTLFREKGDYISAIELVLQHQIFDLADSWITAYLVDIFTTGQTTTFIRWVDTLRKNKYPLPYETLVMYTIALTSIPELQAAQQIIDELEQRHAADRWMEHADHQGVVSIFTTLKAYVLMTIGDNPEKVVEIIVTQLKTGRTSSRWDHIPIQYNQFEPKLSRTLMGAKGKLSPVNHAIAFADFLRQSDFKEQNMMGYSYGVLAEIMYEANLLEDALHEIEGGLKYAHRFQDAGLSIPLYILKSRIYAAMKQFTAAQAVLDHAMQGVNEWYWIRSLQAMKAHCYLMESNIKKAEAELFKTKRPDMLKIELGQELWLLVYVRYLLATNHVQEALPIIIRVKEKALIENQISTIIEASLLEALCYMKVHHNSLAFSTIHKAMELGVTYCYKRTFSDELDLIPLLKKYADFRQKNGTEEWQSVPLTAIEELLNHGYKHTETFRIHLLTPRERDVLRLLASGASNREIAAKLFLSEGTIRVYLTTIYSKLEVQSRTQAILLAKEWDL